MGAGGKGKGGERIEEGKGRKGRGRNVAFHQLLLSNLTTGGYTCSCREMYAEHCG